MIRRLLRRLGWYPKPDPSKGLHPGPLITDRYRIDLPNGWLIDDVGVVTSEDGDIAWTIHGPCKEKVNVLGITELVRDADEPDNAPASAREAVESVMAQFIGHEGCKLLSEPLDGLTYDGCPLREVQLLDPLGQRMALFAVHGP